MLEGKRREKIGWTKRKNWLTKKKNSINRNEKIWLIKKKNLTDRNEKNLIDKNEKIWLTHIKAKIMSHASKLRNLRLFIGKS